MQNTNDFPITITGVAPGTGTNSSNAGTACSDVAPATNPTGVSVITKASGLTGTNLTIPKLSTAAVTIAKVIGMTTASASGCQGAQINIPATGVVLTVVSA